uniref:tRNA (adenine(22)-N(1))-methyltransferase n=1 Tax=Acetatifactor sp. TaxID=1872090 RepID=UPI0040571D1C
MAGREVVLSQRLKSLADMVTPGKSVVDVGCDHGFLSIYLVQHGISPKVLAMDVRKGPLSRAQEHIAEYELGNYIETRLSDGLSEYREGEARSLVCAGMGGKLMMKILTESEEKAKALDELILQPQSDLPAFRRFLKTEGYLTLDENILCEEGKYYFLFKVCFDKDVLNRNPEAEEGIDILFEKYGKLLLQRKHPVLKEYLLFMNHTTMQIADNLQNGEGERSKERLEEVRQELHDLNAALAMFE